VNAALKILPFGGDTIQQVLLLLLFETLVNADEGRHQYEKNDQRGEQEWFRYRIKLLLPIREEPNTPSNYMGMNVHRVSNLGLLQGDRFDGTNRDKRNPRYE
jgi:hypothetical protein